MNWYIWILLKTDFSLRAKKIIMVSTQKGKFSCNITFPWFVKFIKAVVNHPLPVPMYAHCCNKMTTVHISSFNQFHYFYFRSFWNPSTNLLSFFLFHQQYRPTKNYGSTYQTSFNFYRKKRTPHCCYGCGENSNKGQ